MAAEINTRLNIEPQLIEGAGGIFDVKVDGQLIYSKHKTHRFPEHAEIMELLRSRQK